MRQGCPIPLIAVAVFYFGPPETKAYENTLGHTIQLAQAGSVGGRAGPGIKNLSEKKAKRKPARSKKKAHRPVSVVGRWQWVAICMLGTRFTGNFVLRGTNTNLSGPFYENPPSGNGRISDGVVNGNRISFKRHINTIFGTLVQTWTGRFSPRQMTGQISGIGAVGCSFTANR